MLRILSLKWLMTFMLLSQSFQCYANQSFQSTEQASTVVELYTSQGCSSCPPADAWLSKLKQHPNLFSEIVPLAFHVDYWDYIGWKDPFAKNAHSLRQQQLAREHAISAIYTPGFVVNSQEWRTWFRNRLAVPPKPSLSPGVLKGNIQKNTLSVEFNDRSQPSHTNTLLNVAYLGMGLKTHITAGENHQRHLKHDFVVLDHWNAEGKNKWEMTLKPVPDFGQTETALVIWISTKENLKIIQATGTLLKRSPL